MVKTRKSAYRGILWVHDIDYGMLRLSSTLTHLLIQFNGLFSSYK